MLEPDARRDLVDVLAAAAAGADEGLLDVLLENAEALHPEAQGLFLVRGHAIYHVIFMRPKRLIFLHSDASLTD